MEQADSHPNPPKAAEGHFPFVLEYFVEIDEHHLKPLEQEM